MTLTQAAYKLVRYSGLPLLFREVLWRKPTRIIMFHDPEVEAFDRVLTYLGSRYNIITLEHHLSGRPLPPRPLVITLDDGHIGNHALLGLFQKHGVRPTIFVCTGIVGTNRHFWFLHAAASGSSEPFKMLPDEERLSALERIGFTPDREFGSPQALRFDQIEELRSSADLQSHTVTHPCLPNCTDHVAEREITGSKAQLEAIIGEPVTAFAFPNGDYSLRDLDLVRKAGYRCALTVDHGVNTPDGDPFRLKRFSVDDSGDIDALSAKVSGVWGLLNGLLGKRRLTGLKEHRVSTTVSAMAMQLIMTI